MKRSIIGAVIALLALGTSPAHGLGRPQPAPAVGTPIPAHVYAPYFEAWTADSLTTDAQQSGAKYFTIAFLQTLSKGSCTLAWNGDSSQTIASGHYLLDIASLRALGGDVIPSFGGWSADQGGTEIADSCASASSIVAAYKSVITTYNVTRLDMDVEGRSLTNTAGIDRRNKAIKAVEAWATANGRPLTIQYTIGTTASGLDATNLAVLQNAVANGTRVDVVNIMTFDYYDHKTTDMGTAAISAARGLFNQLKTLYPAKTTAQLFAMEGITMMPGIDDYPKKTEVTYPADAQKVETFAKANSMSSLSIWAIQRDNGGCPGSRGRNNCSGIAQAVWQFSQILERSQGRDEPAAIIHRMIHP